VLVDLHGDPGGVRLDAAAVRPKQSYFVKLLGPGEEGEMGDGGVNRDLYRLGESAAAAAIGEGDRVGGDGNAEQSGRGGELPRRPEVEVAAEAFAKLKKSALIFSRPLRSYPGGCGGSFHSGRSAATGGAVSNRVSRMRERREFGLRNIRQVSDVEGLLEKPSAAMLF